MILNRLPQAHPPHPLLSTRSWKCCRPTSTARSTSRSARRVAGHLEDCDRLLPRVRRLRPDQDEPGHGRQSGDRSPGAGLPSKPSAETSARPLTDQHGRGPGYSAGSAGIRMMKSPDLSC